MKTKDEKEEETEFKCYTPAQVRLIVEGIGEP